MPNVRPSEVRLQEQIDLVAVAEQKRRPSGFGLAVGVSFVLHSSLIVWMMLSYKPVVPVETNAPIPRFVELIRQDPREREFTEAPGPEVEKKAPLTAPFSDKNRKASMPEPTGLTPTTRPGEGGSIYTPSTPPPGRPQQQRPQLAQQPQQASPAQQAQESGEPSTPMNLAQAGSDDTFVYRQPTQTTQANAAAASAPIDWRSAIKSVRGPLGGGDSADAMRGSGGEQGTAETGPISFETQWYDWGPYAQSMVSRIRVNWYANMPQLIRTGIAGVVTIRFTIERDGRISEIITLKSSGHPPYDFAARKAIELSSPLNPLPQDFPNPNERVTAMFYYNKRIP